MLVDVKDRRTLCYTTLTYAKADFTGNGHFTYSKIRLTHARTR